MAKWLDIKGPVVADTVYADSTLVAKDVAFTLPGIEFLTADVQAMGNMTVPLIGLLENMELSITKIGVDNGLRRMNRLKKQSFEFRWVQNVVKSDGSTATEGCKAFVRTMPGSFPELGVEVGSLTDGLRRRVEGQRDALYPGIGVPARKPDVIPRFAPRLRVAFKKPFHKL